jgi:hypothetical protein
MEMCMEIYGIASFDFFQAAPQVTSLGQIWGERFITDRNIPYYKPSERMFDADYPMTANLH